MFHEDTKEFASDTKMHVKLLQRLSKCYEVRADESRTEEDKFKWLKDAKREIDQAASLEFDEKAKADIK